MASNYISNAPEIDTLDLTTARAVMDAYGGLAKSCRFFVRILPSGSLLTEYSKDVRDFSYLCESAEFPGRGFMSTDLRYYGPNFKMPYQSSYEDLNLTFICRNEFTEREFFDNWMELINPVSTYNFSYRSEYEATIEMYQMSDLDTEGETTSNAVYSFRFEHVYPMLISPQPATWADDNFHRLTVGFTYTRWYRPGVDSPTVNDYNLVKNAQNNTIDKRGPPLLDPNVDTSRRGPR